MVNRFHGSWNKGCIFITLVILCLQAETPLSLQTGRNHSSRVFLRAQVARENSRREDWWNGVGVCLLFNMSAHTHFSKHPEACVCAHMCCDGWFCCSEPLKAPRFPLGGFSCRRVVSGNDCSFTWRPNWNMMLLNCKEVLISCFCHMFCSTDGCSH